MPAYEGQLWLEGENEPPVDVVIDLSAGRMRVSAGDVEVADWSMDEIRVAALTDGFHIRAAGEEVVIDVTEDGRFAIDLGLRTAHPALRRKMAALLRDDT